MKKILYILWLAILTGEIFSQINFDYSLSQSLIQPGEIFSIRISLPENAQLNDKLLLESKNFALLEKNETQDKNIKTIEYKLTLLEIGEHTIPPLEVQIGSQSQSTLSKKIAVQTTRGDQDETLRPSLPAESAKFPFLNIFLILCLSTVLFFAYKKYKNTLINYFKKPLQEEIPTFNLEEWLHHELKKIFSELKINPEILLTEKINYLVRNFLELKNKKPVLSFTTSEIKTLINNIELIDILSTTDYYKYSNETPASVQEYQNNLFQNTKKELLKCLTS